MLDPQRREGLRRREAGIYELLCLFKRFSHGRTAFFPLPASFNTPSFSLYPAELAKAYPEQKHLMIMDQAGGHKAKDLCISKAIHREFLPLYSPELNPAERLWQWLRRHVCRNRLLQSEDQLMDELQRHLGRLNQKPLNRYVEPIIWCIRRLKWY